MQFILNDKEVDTNVPYGMVLLDYIRYHQNLTGTKIGCREGDCGACTVLVGELINDELRYRSVNSCLMAIGNAQAKHIVTIEGINMQELNPIQQAMYDEAATQCGFCTPGFVMSLAGYCLSDKEANEKNAIASIDGNICRCTGYKSIERAAMRVNELLIDKRHSNPKKYVTDNNILPQYFTSIKQRLNNLITNHPIFNNPQTDNQILLGGGTDLYVQKHDTMIDASIHFLFDKVELKGITEKDGYCYIGASSTVTDLCESLIIQNHFPRFNEYAKLISSTPIRNTATLAGNFINASPIGDFTIFFLALNTVLVMNDGKSKREIALKDLYKAYKTLDKNPEEFIEFFYFKLPTSNTKFNFEKVSKRAHLDIASVNTAISIIVEQNKIIDVSLSAGGVFAYPKYLNKTCDYLLGKTISKDTINTAIEIMQSEIAPISDARGTEAYKRLLLSQLIKAHFITLFGENSIH